MTVPAILGLCRALKGTAKSRAAAFREICGEEEGEGEREVREGEGEVGREFDFQTQDIFRITEMVSHMERIAH